MKTTLYVALERLIDMSDASDWKLDEALAASIISQDCRLVAAFAPHRFGLIFDSREEIDEAWDFIRHWLQRKGLQFEARCVVLKHDADVSEFSATEQGTWLANRDDSQSEMPNIRLVDELPRVVMPFSKRIKRLMTAMLF